MDLVITDAEWNDLGTISPSNGDFAYGSEENDFSLDLDYGVVPEVGALLYAEGTDLGGEVTGYESDVGNGYFSVTGQTWTGILNRRILCPPSGSDYFSVSGDCRDCVASIVSASGADYLFEVAGGKTGVTTSRTFKTFQVHRTPNDADRYMPAWNAVWMTVSRCGCSARLAYDPTRRKVVMTVRRRAEYTDEEAASAGVALLGVTRSTPANHLVCLGAGDLRARTVAHVYADATGAVSTSRSLTGRREVMEVYDDAQAEDLASLVADGESRLRDLWGSSQSVSVATGNPSVAFDLGDLVGGTDVRTGIKASAVISKKVARFDRGNVTWTYSSTVRG